MTWGSPSRVKGKEGIPCGMFRPQCRWGWPWSTGLVLEPSQEASLHRQGLLSWAGLDFIPASVTLPVVNIWTSGSVSASINWGLKMPPSYVYASDALYPSWTFQFSHAFLRLPFALLRRLAVAGLANGSPHGRWRVRGRQKPRNSLPFPDLVASLERRCRRGPSSQQTGPPWF